jgi:hypothetical protein
VTLVAGTSQASAAPYFVMAVAGNGGGGAGKIDLSKLVPVATTLIGAFTAIAGGLSTAGSRRPLANVNRSEDVLAALRTSRKYRWVALSSSPARWSDETLDQLAMRDWVWSAFEGLSEPLRLPLILRHFTQSRSYRDIAHLCRAQRRS